MLLQIGGCARVAVSGFEERMQRLDVLVRECALQLQVIFHSLYIVFSPSGAKKRYTIKKSTMLPQAKAL
jgi:hypothetical protein